MEILNNFASIYCYIAFVIGAVLMLMALAIAAMGKDKEPRNKVRFYLVKTSFAIFDLFLGYPIKSFGSCGTYWTGNRIHINMKDCGLNPDDYIDLDYDKPVEVFLNLED